MKAYLTDRQKWLEQRNSALRKEWENHKHEVRSRVAYRLALQEKYGIKSETTFYKIINQK